MTPNPRTRIEHLCKLFGTWLLTAIVGCGSQGPKLAPVSGTLLYGGRPVAEAQIVLYPLDGQGANLPRPSAVTDEQGNFAITTLQHADGAAPGKYTLTVELRAPRRHGEETIRDGKNLLPARLAKPATSGIEREVQPGANVWAPVDLKQL